MDMKFLNINKRRLFVRFKRIFIVILMANPSFLLAKPFVEGHLMGQFGNQMFIIAAATSLALDHEAEAIFPSLRNSQEFNIPFNYRMAFYHLNASQPKNNLESTYYEPHYIYEEIPYQPNMKIVGWFQSEKYFIKHKQEILSLFEPNSEIMAYLNNKYSDIIHHPQTVSIHLRSYHIENPEVAQCYITYGTEYVEKAMKSFPENSLFVVFSNQMGWCKKILENLPGNIQFIEGENYIYDFYLMSLCKNNIICNSSFSWWAAYLNKNPHKIVIVPPVWFHPSYKSELETKDLIPKEWILLKY
jgi:hypothetical protein